MKIACAGDAHLTTRKPMNRKDDYYKTALGKFRQELEIAEEEGCDYLILPGDVFDTPKESHLLVQDVINLINEFAIQVLVVAGQHDQRFHNPDLAGTAFNTLVVADAVTLLDNEPFLSPYADVAFYGASWKNEIPEITTPDRLNVLVLHKMIVDEKLWAEQEGHTWATPMLATTKFDLIVSGDNHQQFTISRKDRHLVNMGSMLRSTIAQAGHHPAVTIYDAVAKGIKLVPLECAPFEEIMQMEKVTKEKERNAQLEAFVKAVKKKEEVELDFVQALNHHLDTNEVDEPIRNILKECLE